MNPETAQKIFSRFAGVKILVIGDIMCDEYIWGEVTRISPEAPVPVVLAKKENRVPGGATNVLNNLVALGVQASILGVVGKDENGRKLEQKLRNFQSLDNHLFFADDRPTIMKTRILAQNQQLIRLDREKTLPIPPDIEQSMLATLRDIIPGYDAVVLSDYDKGVLNASTIPRVIEIIAGAGKYIAVDPQVRHFSLYAGSDIMTPNEKEASEGIKEAFPEGDPEAIRIGEKILATLKLKELLLTRSHKGMALFSENKVHLIPTVAREVYDVSGAGDTVISVFTASRMAGATSLEAARLSNIAGGVVVGKLGTATTSIHELTEVIKKGV